MLAQDEWKAFHTGGISSTPVERVKLSLGDSAIRLPPSEEASLPELSSLMLRLEYRSKLAFNFVMPASAIPKIFYQSSMPRSGSTLLQNIFAQNPDFYVTPTSGMLELIFGARLNYTNSPEFKAQDSASMKRAFLAFSRAGMEAYFRALTDKPYVLDKSRGWGVHFDLLNQIFEGEPKIICMVRDLRQILASMEKKFRQNPDKYRPIENHNSLSGTTTLKRAVVHLQTPPVGLALDRIAEIHQRGWNKKIHFIRFEDLTTKPKQTLENIYTYLGLKEFTHDFENVTQVTQEDDQVHGIPGLHNIRPKVEPSNNDYLSILGKDAVRFVQNNYAWYFTHFDYQTSPV